MLTFSHYSALKLAIILMVVSTLMLATMHVLVRLLGDASMGNQIHPFVIVFFRNLFGAIAIVPLIKYHGLGLFRTNHLGLHALRAPIGIIAILTFFYALTKVPVANVTALSFSTTLFATLSAAILIKEPIRLRRSIAIAIGLVGVFVVLRPSASGFNIYSLLVLVAAIGWGLSVTLVKKLTEFDSSITIVAIMSFSLTALSLPPALLYWQTPSLSQLGLLFVLGCLASGGHLLLTEALKRADVAIVMSLDFLRLVWTSILGAWLFSEYLDAFTLYGAIIIFASGWYILRRESLLQADKSLK